jgi:energy-converting hydrogenase Eha subunit B
MIATWGDVLSASLKNIWLGIANFIPTLLAAIVIIAVGLIIGKIFFKLVENLIKFAKIDGALKAAGFEKIVEKAGFKLDSGYFLGKLVEWFFIIVFLVAAFDVLGLKQVTAFLSDVVLGYLPQVIVAVLIILVAAIVAEAMQKIVVGAAKAAEMKSVNFAGKITKWAIWIFALLAAIMQLGIAVSFIQTLFTGIVIAVSLALGLSFGLGGQDAAAKYIEKIKGDISDNGSMGM